MLVEDVLIKRRWKSYFQRLLNDEGDKGIVLRDLEYFEGYCDYDYYGHIRFTQVKGDIFRIHRVRATLSCIFGRALARQG